MSREEIKEGIRDALRQYHNLEMAKRPDDKTDYLYVIQESLINRLHSKGVVIKVDRELPRVDSCLEAVGKLIAVTAQSGMLKAGYVAVEPLIEGV